MSDRRYLVNFDPDHFSRQAETPDPLSAFRFAHRENFWKGSETPSGAGSGLDQTAGLVAALPGLFRRVGVRRVLDVPCGGFHWMSRVDLSGIEYIGGDLVPEVVESAAATYPGPNRRFMVLDLTTSRLPAADLLLCRDCLVHLSVADIGRVVRNVRRSGIPYLLTTTFTAERENRGIVTGDWRPLNLQAPPFSFPEPETLVVEGCTEHDGAFADKSLALWRVADLPEVETS